MKMNNKLVAAGVSAVLMLPLAACGSTHHHHDKYERVYNRHTHSYVVVTHNYYTHHRNLYSGTPQVVHSPKATSHATPSPSKTKLKDKVKKTVQKHVNKYKARKDKRR